MSFHMIKKVVLVILLLVFPSASAWAQDYVPGEVIVKLKSRTDSGSSYQFIGKAQLQKNMTLKRSWKRMKMYHFKVKSGQSVDDTILDLRNDPDVEFAEPNYILKKSGNDTHEILSSSEVVSMAVGGDYTVTDADIGVDELIPIVHPGAYRPIVAVIDTGMDISHRVFTQSGALYINSGEIPGNGIDDDGNGYVDDVNGWNFITNSGTMFDDDDHGTHVAGAILSVGVNILENPVNEASIRIMPLKFLDSQGLGTTSDAIEAIRYAVDNGATVLNNSWGGSSYSTALHEAVVYSYSKGALFVAAAGNLGANNDHTPIYPASLDVPNVVSVAATMNDDSLATFSNYGKNTVNVGSPGVYILSTISSGNFAYMSGTSMASPFVAGIAALVKAQAPSMLGYQMKDIIEGEAESAGSLKGKVTSESRVNALNSYYKAGSVSVLSDQPIYSIQGGRGIASEDAAGGCGIVSKLVMNQKNGYALKEFGRGYKWFAFLFLLGPIAYMMFLRMKSPEQRRQFERFDVSSQVRLKVGDKELIGSVSSLSLGGVQVNTDALLENGGIVRMSISSPDGKEEIQVAGQVVWSQERKAYGVKFAETNSATLNAISGWTQKLKKTAV